jgi:hypothetical protein
MSCGNETDQDKDSCECGSRSFVYGNNLKFEDKKISCGCGNSKLTMSMHMNCNPYYYKTYKCDCGSVIGTQTYYESPYY